MRLSQPPRSDGLQIGCRRLAAAAVGFDVEGQLLAFVEIAHPGALDRRDVNEHVGAAAVLDDEAETLLGIEELDGTLSHIGLLERAKASVGRTTICAGRYPDLRGLEEGPCGQIARQAIANSA